MYQRTRLFENGTGGYRAFTTPTLLTTASGAILAICEGRNSDPTVMGGDSGDIDLVMRRSLDGGRSWEPKRLIVRTGPDTDGNPAPVLDRDTGIVWLLFCKNFADGPENLIVEGKAPRTVWVTCSRDEGESWAEPREITGEVKDPSWTWYATGPGHGQRHRAVRRPRHHRPADQERDAGAGVEEALLLPGVVVAEVIAMIGEEADQRVVRIRARVHRIQNRAEAGIDVGDLAVVARLEDARVRPVDRLRPDDVVHPRNRLVQVVDLEVPGDRVGHAVGIVHPVERDRRRERRMRPDERHESEPGPRVGAP